MSKTTTPDLAAIDKAQMILVKMTEKSPTTLYMGIWTTFEVNEAIRTILDAYAEQGRKLEAAQLLALKQFREADAARAQGRASLEEGLTICRNMVKAEDDLIAELQADGRWSEILSLDMPIMRRMRAFVARTATPGERENG